MDSLMIKTIVLLGKLSVRLFKEETIKAICNDIVGTVGEEILKHFSRANKSNDSQIESVVQRIDLKSIGVPAEYQEAAFADAICLITKVRDLEQLCIDKECDLEAIIDRIMEAPSGIGISKDTDALNRARIVVRIAISKSLEALGGNNGFNREAILKAINTNRQQTHQLTSIVKKTEERAKDIQESLEETNSLIKELTASVKQNGSCVDKDFISKSNTEDYLKAYNEPLFLESQLKDGNAALLSDVYIPADYKDQTGKRRSIRDLLFDYFYGKALPTEGARSVMIMGKPGSGKSSFISYIGTQILEKMPGKTFFVVRLRNMLSEQINNNDPLSGLLEYIGIDQHALHNSILILDGLDEICALYRNTDFRNYLTKLLQNLTQVKNCKLVVTSRTGYFSLDDRIKRFFMIVQIENWENKELERWSEAYIKKHPGLRQTVLDNTKHLEEDACDKKEIFAVPILFYMANARSELLSKHQSICSLYDAVLKEVMDDRNYDPAYNMPNQELISPQLARQICIEIAFSMFRKGRLNYSSDDPFLEPSEVDLALGEATEVCSEKPVPLNEETKNRIKSVYALTFYYNKSDDNHNAVEFAHRTIAEYFTSEKILQMLCSADDSTDEMRLCEILAECFGYAPITNDVLLFLEQKLIYDENKQKLKHIKKALEAYFFIAAIDGNLFIKPQKSDSDIHCLDRLPIMVKSVLTIFERLNCQVAKLDEQQREMFNNLIASTSRIRPINSQHNSLLPLALNGFDLSGGDFSECNFSEAHLSGANLREADFSSAVLTDAQLNGSIIDSANFSDASMDYADLSDIKKAKSVEFTDSTLIGADFHKSQFRNCSFDSVSLREANLDACVFGKGCHFEEANLYKAQMTGSDFSKSDIQGIVFEDEEDENEVTSLTQVILSPKQYEYLSTFQQVEIKGYKTVGGKKSEKDTNLSREG